VSTADVIGELISGEEPIASRRTIIPKHEVEASSRYGKIGIQVNPPSTRQVNRDKSSNQNREDQSSFSS
jgi:hypothetical protein